MTHAEMNELYDLYALGVLEPEFAAEIQSHIAEGCTYCAEQLAASAALSSALAGIAEPANPRAALRKRIVASVAPARGMTRGWMAALAGLSAACVALAFWAFVSDAELMHVRGQVAVLTGERDQLRAALEFLTNSDTRSVQFGKAGKLPHGQVVLSPNGGLVFVAAEMPPIAANRSFELWLIPPAGAPKAAGVFRASASGQSIHVLSGSIDVSQVKAVAVSIEPLAGSNAPTTTPILIVPVG